MKTTAELQARLDAIQNPAGLSEIRNYELIELIEEILRLREDLVTANGKAGFILRGTLKADNPPGPIKWITGKPYRNE